MALRLIYAGVAIAVTWFLAALEILDLRSADRRGAAVTVLLLGTVATIVGVPLARRIHGVGVGAGPGTVRGSVLTGAGVLCGFALAAAMPEGTGKAAMLVVAGGVVAGLILTSPKLK